MSLKQYLWNLYHKVRLQLIKYWSILIILLKMMIYNVLKNVWQLFKNIYYSRQKVVG